MQTDSRGIWARAGQNLAPSSQALYGLLLLGLMLTVGMVQVKTPIPGSWIDPLIMSNVSTVIGRIAKKQG